MSDDQVKELSPAFAGSDLEETVPVPVPIEVEGTAVVLPQNPPSDLHDAEAWPSEEVSAAALEPYESECSFIDDGEIGLSVEGEESEKKGKSENENESERENRPVAALDVQVDIDDTQRWPGEEVIYGRLHLYKTYRKAARKHRVKHTSMLGILNIPAMVTRINLRNFLEPFQEAIDEVKIIKDSTPSQYMALIKFNAKDVADTFYTVYSGCSFIEKDNEQCQLVRVGRFDVLNSRGRASFPMKSLIELPRCTICLERTGESMQSIFTWLCDQSFDGQSQQSQNGTVCPVCTYGHVQQQEEPRCLECGVRSSLHICLICGLVRCGQNMTGHAEKHFNETKHAYGMQLKDCKVWDYIEQKYVQSAVCTSNMGQYGREANEDKLGAVQLEYSYLLSSQLESQQIFWERKMFQLEKGYIDEINHMKARLASTNEKCDKLEHEKNDLLKEKQAIEEKCTHLNTKLSKLFTQLKEEQEMNKSLRADQILLKKQLEEEEKVLKETCGHIDMQITNMQEHVQHVVIYLQAQQKSMDLSTEATQESQEEQVSVATDAPPSSPKVEEL